MTNYHTRVSEFWPLVTSVIMMPMAIVCPNQAVLVLGPLVAVIAFAVFIPQAITAWRWRNDPHALRGISLTTNAFIVNNSILWGLYAWELRELWVGAAGLINAPLAAMIIVLVIRSRAMKQTGDPHAPFDTGDAGAPPTAGRN